MVVAEGRRLARRSGPFLTAHFPMIEIRPLHGSHARSWRDARRGWTPFNLFPHLFPSPSLFPPPLSPFPPPNHTPTPTPSSARKKLTDDADTTGPTEAASQAAEEKRARGEQTAENTRYGESISEHGFGGETTTTNNGEGAGAGGLSEEEQQDENARRVRSQQGYGSGSGVGA